MLEQSTQNGTNEPVNNVLVRDTPDTAQKQPETAAKPYDAEAENALPYKVVQDGLEYDIAHVFGPVSDDRYMQWQRDMKVRGNGDKLEEEAREANCKLWNEIIVRLDGFDYDPNMDWRSLLPDVDKNESINHLFAVAVFVEGKKAEGKAQLGKRDSQTITTEAYFNGDISSQTHTMRVRTFELEKEYERIIAKQTRLETTKGLRRKPLAEFVPQDDKLGALYDKMLIASAGFANSTPLRFKVAVVKFIFAPNLDPRLVGK